MSLLPDCGDPAPPTPREPPLARPVQRASASAHTSPPSLECGGTTPPSTRRHDGAPAPLPPSANARPVRHATSLRAAGTRRAAPCTTALPDCGDPAPPTPREPRLARPVQRASASAHTSPPSLECGGTTPPSTRRHDGAPAPLPPSANARPVRHATSLRAAGTRRAAPCTTALLLVLAVAWSRAAEPTAWSAALPEGNYRVTLTLGSEHAASTTTVKAENRRLMLEAIPTAAGQHVTRSFAVNLRHDTLPPGNQLKLNPRERDPQTGAPKTPTWDDRLSLAFLGQNPSVSDVRVEPLPNATTVFLVGDSTVTDQTVEPYGSWGQMLPRWFDNTVAVANHAESGETLKAFRAERRWEKVMLLLKPGDYVLLQFGHNDLNTRGHNGIWPPEDTLGDWAFTYSDARTEYPWLLAAYAVEVKRRGAIPVILSPMTKIDLRTGGLNTGGLGEYPRAAAEAARLSGAAFIDLNALSIEIMRGLGPEDARRAYVDGLHTNSYGAYLLARAICVGLSRARLPLAGHLIDDAAAFDPAHPTPLPGEFRVPLEPVP